MGIFFANRDAQQPTVKLLLLLLNMLKLEKKLSDINETHTCIS